MCLIPLYGTQNLWEPGLGGFLCTTTFCVEVPWSLHVHPSGVGVKSPNVGQGPPLRIQDISPTVEPPGDIVLRCLSLLLAGIQ